MCYFAFYTTKENLFVFGGRLYVGVFHKQWLKHWCYNVKTLSMLSSISSQNYHLEERETATI